MINPAFQAKMTAERDRQDSQYKVILSRLNDAHADVKKGVGDAQVAAFLSAFGIDAINDLTDKELPEFLEHADEVNWFYISKLHNRNKLIKYVHNSFLNINRPALAEPEGLVGSIKPISYRRSQEQISIDEAREAMDRLHGLAGDCTLLFMFDPKDMTTPEPKRIPFLH